MTENPVVLKIKHLNLSILRDKVEIPILRDINMEVHRGEHWAVAGESGAGKSMTMYVLTSLLPDKSTIITGEIYYREADGSYTDILKLPFKKRSLYCADKAALIFQDSINALNPFETIGTQWRHTLRYRRQDLRREQQEAHMRARLVAFGISDCGVLRKYPHQLSGGMKQRIAIAMALESDADILIADEPTTSLDALNQRNIVSFIDELCKKKGLTLIYISHNIALLDTICDHGVIVKNGSIVESGRTDQIFHNPENPYTKELINETRKLVTVV